MTSLADSCPALPYTGLPLLSLLVVAGICLLAGVLLLLVTRSRAAVAVAGLVLVVGGLTLGSPPAPAEAAARGPVSSTGHLTLTQTSVLTGLAPGVAPLTITGAVLNSTDDSTWVEAVVVRVASVTQAPGAPAGTCGVGDYVLLDPRMPVGRTLGPNATTAFSGAQIGFNSTSADQDACKAATVHLHYETSP